MQVHGLVQFGAMSVQEQQQVEHRGGYPAQLTGDEDREDQNAAHSGDDHPGVFFLQPHRDESADGESNDAGQSAQPQPYPQGGGDSFGFVKVQKWREGMAQNGGQRHRDEQPLAEPAQLLCHQKGKQSFADVAQNGQHSYRPAAGLPGVVGAGIAVPYAANVCPCQPPAEQQRERNAAQQIANPRPQQDGQQGRMIQK